MHDLHRLLQQPKRRVGIGLAFRAVEAKRRLARVLPSSDGELTLTVGQDREAELWRTRSGRRLRALGPSDAAVRAGKAFAVATGNAVRVVSASDSQSRVALAMPSRT